MDELSTLAGRVRFARAQRRLTQDQLAERAGLKQGDISKIENDRIRRTTALNALSRALRCDPDWLETGEGSFEVPDAQAPDFPRALKVMRGALIDLDAATRARAGFLLGSFANDPEGPWADWLTDLVHGTKGLGNSRLAAQQSATHNPRGSQQQRAGSSLNGGTKSRPISLGNFDTNIPPSEEEVDRNATRKGHPKGRGQH